jgi:PEP-CTERM/exosortase A-associated glycosyltransferase
VHILHIFDHSIPLQSGYSFRSLAIIREQRRRGWDTSHITGPKQGPGQALSERVDGLLFHRTPGTESLLARLPGVQHWQVIRSLAKRLLEVAGDLRPDILHAHSPALNGIAALRVGRRLGIPVVYEVRAFWEDAAVDHGTTKEGEPRYRLTRALETHVLREARQVTTICEGLRREIVGRGIPAGKVTVIPNAVDLEQFSSGRAADAVLAEKLGLTNKLVLGFIGSFYQYEGLPLLLEALPAILRTVPNVRLLLVGGGPAEDRIRQLVKELDLGEWVVMPGRVPHREVEKYYDLVNVFVYPRLPIRLTELVTPLKPLEAMAQGRLVVASDVGGHRELIRHGKTGLLFKAGDPNALAETVTDLLKNPTQWSILSSSARRFVEQERNWSVSVSRYEGVYAEAVQTGALG